MQKKISLIWGLKPHHPLLLSRSGELHERGVAPDHALLLATLSVIFVMLLVIVMAVQLPVRARQSFDVIQNALGVVDEARPGCTTWVAVWLEAQLVVDLVENF